jgi:hypothetical protein
MSVEPFLTPLAVSLPHRVLPRSPRQLADRATRLGHSANGD